MKSSSRKGRQSTMEAQDVFAEIKINPRKKFLDSAAIRTQDLLNTSKILLSLIKPLGPLAEEQKMSYISSIAQRPQPNSNLFSLSQSWTLSELDSLRAGHECLLSSTVQSSEAIKLTLVMVTLGAVDFTSLQMSVA